MIAKVLLFTTLSIGVGGFSLIATEVPSSSSLVSCLRSSDTPPPPKPENRG